MTPARTLLLVDDDEDIREALSDLLRFDGWHVVPADDGEVALRWLATNPRPHAILLDLKMPRCDGYQFRRIQSADARWRDIPTIVLTADGRVKSDTTALFAGLPIANKPIDWH